MEDGPSDAWNGLRVRIGVHHCLECDPQFDAVHGRYDYYGHDVNVSARVESMAQGGQILMTADTHKKLIEDPEFEDSIGCEAVVSKFATGVELKGVSEHVAMYSCAPTNLSLRRFNPIGDATTGQLGDDSSDSNAMSVDIQSVLSGGNKSTEVAGTVRLIFNNMSKVALKNNVLNDVMQNRKMDVANAGTSFQRKLKALINNIQQEIAPIDNGMAGSVVVNDVNGSSSHGSGKMKKRSMHKNSSLRVTQLSQSGTSSTAAPPEELRNLNLSPIPEDLPGAITTPK